MIRAIEIIEIYYFVYQQWRVKPIEKHNQYNSISVIQTATMTMTIIMIGMTMTNTGEGND